MQNYKLENLDCANCALKIEDKLRNAPGVNDASINFATSTLSVDADSIIHVQEIIHSIEPDVKIDLGNENRQEVSELLSKKYLPIIRLAVSLILFIFGLLYYPTLHATPYHWAEYLVFLPAYLLSGYPVLIGAARNLRRRQIFDEYFLMTIATLGAWIIHEVPEAVGVMIFFMIGEFLQELSLNRSRRSIQELISTHPDTANLKSNGGIQSVPVEIVQPGDKIIVRPGERVPLDGVVVEGDSYVDTAALTGEHVPRWYESGDDILAGMIVQNTMLTIRVVRKVNDSSISRIMELVENAQNRKSPTERFVTKFARYYTPVVVLLASAIAFLPPLFIPGAELSNWFYRALVVLVISCPCALVISIPLGYFGGIGAASRKGILVKGSNFLDILASVKTVIFDKTGTLTRGNFEVQEIRVENGRSQDELLHIAELAESQSTHPIAQSIRNKSNRISGSKEELDRFEELPGLGVRAFYNGRVLIAGNDLFLHREGVDHPDCDISGTVVHIADQGEYVGYIRIDDQIKPDSRSAIQDLHKIGVAQIVMLTGDQDEQAARIAAELGIDSYSSELLPEDKLRILESIIQTHKFDKVAYVGDGINDAPSIARADVGIAMGALGSQAAIETADVVIMGDAPSKIAEAIRFGKRTRRIVLQNIILALGIKVLFILLGISGEASMWEAVFADMGVALLAILNTVRIFR